MIWLLFLKRKKNTFFKILHDELDLIYTIKLADFAIKS